MTRSRFVNVGQKQSSDECVYMWGKNNQVANQAANMCWRFLTASRLVTASRFVLFPAHVVTREVRKARSAFASTFAMCEESETGKRERDQTRRHSVV